MAATGASCWLCTVGMRGLTTMNAMIVQRVLCSDVSQSEMTGTKELAIAPASEAASALSWHKLRQACDSQLVHMKLYVRRNTDILRCTGLKAAHCSAASRSPLRHVHTSLAARIATAHKPLTHRSTAIVFASLAPCIVNPALTLHHLERALDLPNRTVWIPQPVLSLVTSLVLTCPKAVQPQLSSAQSGHTNQWFLTAATTSPTVTPSSCLTTYTSRDPISSKASGSSARPCAHVKSSPRIGGWTICICFQLACR